MNKVININFQGRVIPIEEPAYEELKKYVESLRAHFANEEGREEIINDIENRIAELLSEKLKKGDSTFITDEHVMIIIAGIGRPEQFDEVAIDNDTSSTSSNQSEKKQESRFEPRGSLYRNANDKMLGGVCSGLAAYLRIDTTIVRILFALLTFGAFGTGLLLYIILWAILPAKAINAISVSRKLYRDADQKVIGGVAGGIAHYFNIAFWIPRLVFALPVIIGFLKIPFHLLFFPIAASFSGTIFIIYLILWAVVPKAVTASEKLEMKGQRVDIESIKNKVQDELLGVKKNVSESAATWKNNISQKANEIGQEAKERAEHLSREAGPAFKKSGSSFGRVILGLIKLFIFFILGVIAVSLIASLIAIIGISSALMPLKDFLVNQDTIMIYAWGVILFFLAVPVIGILITLIRRIAGRKPRSPYIAFGLLILWLIGFASLVLCFTTISKEFSRAGSVRNEIPIAQPSEGRMKINFKSPNGNYYPLNFDDNDVNGDLSGLMLSAKEDSLLLRNIKIRLERSRDDSFHVTLIKRARSSSSVNAEQFAEKISYPIDQFDSLFILPLSFPITTDSKFRNQQVIVQVEVPVGREIYIDEKADKLSWFSVKRGVQGFIISNEDETDPDYFWRPGVWYIMTDGGIEKKYPDPNGSDNMIEKIEQGIRKELKNEKIDLENFELNIKDGDTSIKVKIQTKPTASVPNKLVKAS